MGVDWTVSQKFAGVHLLAITHHHVPTKKDRVFSDRIVGFDHGHRGELIIFSLFDFNGSWLFAKDRRLTGTPRLK